MKKIDNLKEIAHMVDSIGALIKVIFEGYGPKSH